MHEFMEQVNKHKSSSSCATGKHVECRLMIPNHHRSNLQHHKLQPQWVNTFGIVLASDTLVNFKWTILLYAFLAKCSLACFAQNRFFLLVEISKFFFVKNISRETINRH